MHVSAGNATNGRSPLDTVTAEIRRHGPLPVARVLESALYEPQVGFYERGGQAGSHGGDFITSAEVGPLFGAVVARALDSWWHELGEPDPYVVVDAGAGPGTLARTVLAADPACAPVLRYVLVERSAAQRRMHGEHLHLEDPVLAFAPVESDGETPVPGAPKGPICVSLADLPRVSGPVVVLANELLDNVPFDLVERGRRGWQEVRVGFASATPAPGRSPALREVLVPLVGERGRQVDALAPDAQPGSRVALQDAARAWLRDALDVAGPEGRVVVFDYGTTTPAMAARPMEEWLRTYRGHDRGGSYLDDLGGQDVTCEVAVDQLALVRPATTDLSQADWLRAHGIDGLVDEGRRIWSERAHLADLDAMRGRSRVNEAAALTAPDGLGAFRVVEWTGD